MSRRFLILVLLLAIIILLAIYGVPLWNRFIAGTFESAMPDATVIPSTEISPTSMPPSVTPNPPTAVSTASNGVPEKCVQALAITREQIGQTLCVGGIVENAFGRKGDYYIYFNQSNLDALFFVSFGWPSSGTLGVNKGECIYIENAKIIRFGERSLMVSFLPTDIKHCKAAATP
jgi:hypothetical protein